MRYRIGVAVLIMIVAAIAPLAGRAAPPKDWILATMTVGGGTSSQPVGGGGGGGFAIGGPGGPGASLVFSGAGHSTGEGPVLMGTGGGFGPLHFVDVSDFANGGTRLRTTNDLGGFDIEITPVGNVGFAFIMLLGSGSPNVKQITALFFVTNAVIDSYSVKGSGGSAPSVKTGSGSSVIDVAGPKASGVAVDASAVAAGASTVEATLAKGIVGGVTYGCTRCTVDWTAPDHVTGSVTQTNLPRVPLPVPVSLPVGGIDGDTMFEGPSGPWSWSWTGANVRLEPSPSTIGAFAPIGDDWQLFRRGIRATPGPASPSNPPQPKSDTNVKAEKQTRTLAATGVGGGARGLVFVALAGLAALWLVATRKSIGVAWSR